MSTSRQHRVCRLASAFAAGAVVLAATVPANAQFQGDDASVDGVSPPRPGKADDSAPIVMTYLVGILLLGAAVGANLIPPKRGHQD